MRSSGSPASHDVVAAARGVGVMRALELTIDATPVIEGALKPGLLVNRTAERVVRMLPPLTVTQAEIRRGGQRFSTACSRVCSTEVTT